MKTLITCLTTVFTLATVADAQLIVPENLKAVSQVPSFGTFWLAKGPEGKLLPPYPVPPPDDLGFPIYRLEEGQFLIDNSSEYADVTTSASGTGGLGVHANTSPPSPGGGLGGGGYWPTNDTRRNLGKFAMDAFGVIDTNSAATSDPTLYAACNSFPRSTNTGPNLQIRTYGKYGALLKANHFNYSGETVRDFALLINNKAEIPTWKSIDILGSSDSQDGWLVQGIVPHRLVTDPMFLLVTNFNTWTPIFFKVVPYSGPQVQLTGPAPNSWVSNTITLHATITDLSGVTNEQFEVDVNSDPTRTNFSSGNTITLDTHYNVAGPENVNFNVAASPVPIIGTNPPDDAKLIFTGSATLPLNFTNATYLWSASDTRSPNAGTNYVLVVHMPVVVQTEETVERLRRGERVAVIVLSCGQE